MWVLCWERYLNATKKPDYSSVRGTQDIKEGCNHDRLMISVLLMNLHH